MTRSPTTMRPDDDLADVVEMMLVQRTRSVPISDDGTLVGIVSRRDVLRAVARRAVDAEQARRQPAGGEVRPR